jgi:hypothetical protein
MLEEHLAHSEALPSRGKWDLVWLPRVGLLFQFCLNVGLKLNIGRSALYNPDERL